MLKTHSTWMKSLIVWLICAVLAVELGEVFAQESLQNTLKVIIFSL